MAHHFAAQIELLRDVVNYGSNLLPRCFESSEKSAADVIVLAGLAKQVLAMLDGVEIQVAQGAILASHVAARALYEAVLYLEWLLESDTLNRARCYYVWNLRQRRMWANRVIPNTAENAKFQPTLQQLPTFQSTDPADQQLTQEVQDEAKKQSSEIDLMLNGVTYKPINDDFDTRRKNRDYDVPWYAPTGVTSIRKIAEALGRAQEYDVMYSGLSDVAHASCFQKHVVIQDGEAIFEPVRNLDSIDFVIRFSVTLAFRAFRRLLETYRPGEIENFNRKYATEWREAFMNIKSVKYTAVATPRP